MSSSLVASMKRPLAFLVALLLAFLSTSCATTSSSARRTYPTVAKPAADSADYSAWQAYYYDQFQVFGDKVEAPAASAPVEAKRAYDDAKQTWREMTAQSKQIKTYENVNTLLYIGVGAGTIALLLMAL